MIREKGIFECLKKRATALNRKEGDIHKLQIITYCANDVFCVYICVRKPHQKERGKNLKGDASVVFVMNLKDECDMG